MGLKRTFLYIGILSWIYLSRQVLKAQDSISPIAAPWVKGLLIKDPGDSLKKMLLSNASDSLKLQVFKKFSYAFTDKAEVVLGMILQLQEHAEKLNDERTKALYLRKIGVAYNDRNYFDRAIEYTLKSAVLFEKINDKIGLANCYSNIGNFYNNKAGVSNDPLFFDRSIEFHLKGIQCHIDADTRDSSAIANAYNNIGEAYFAKGDNAMALKYYSRSQRIYTKTSEYNGIFMSNENLGNVYFQMGLKDRDPEKFRQAIFYFKKAVDWCRKKGIVWDIYARLLTQTGRVYCEMGETATGMLYLNEGYDVALKIKNNGNIMNASRYLAEYLQKAGDYKRATQFLNVYNSAKDSLINEKNRASIEQMAALYQSQQKDREIERLSAEERFQRTITFVTVSGSILLVLFVIIFIRGYRRKLHAENLLSLKDKEISIHQANMAGQEEERTRIAKELHDSIGNNLASIKLHLGDLRQSLGDLPLDNIITQVNDTLKEVRTISHNLMPLKFSNTSLKELLMELANRFAIPGKLSVEVEYFQKDNTWFIPENIKLDVYRISQELFNNIVKHARASQIMVNLLIDGGVLYLSIDDNGIGFSLDHSSHGIGLRNITNRVELLNGELHIDSKPGRGTAVNISFPLTRQTKTIKND